MEGSIDLLLQQTRTQGIFQNDNMIDALVSRRPHTSELYFSNILGAYNTHKQLFLFFQRKCALRSRHSPRSIGPTRQSQRRAWCLFADSVEWQCCGRRRHIHLRRVQEEGEVVVVVVVMMIRWVERGEKGEGGRGKLILPTLRGRIESMRFQPPSLSTVSCW